MKACENCTEKEENARNQHFLLFQQFCPTLLKTNVCKFASFPTLLHVHIMETTLSCLLVSLKLFLWNGKSHCISIDCSLLAGQSLLFKWPFGRRVLKANRGKKKP